MYLALDIEFIPKPNNAFLKRFTRSSQSLQDSSHYRIKACERLLFIGEFPLSFKNPFCKLVQLTRFNRNFGVMTAASVLKLNIPTIAPRGSTAFAQALKVCCAVNVFQVDHAQFCKGTRLVVLLKRCVLG